MNKKLFVFLIILMSLSLVGIIMVQAYFINNIIKNEENQFWFKINKTISQTVKKVEDREYNEVVDNLKKQLSKDGFDLETEANFFATLSIFKRDKATNTIKVFDTDISEGNYKNSSLFDKTLDSFPSLFSLRSTTTREEIYKTFNVDGNTSFERVSNKENIGIQEVLLNKNFEPTYINQAKSRPIHNRVTVDEIKQLIKLGLSDESLNIPFEFAIYDRDLATKIQTEDFETTDVNTVNYPIFSKTNADNYKLFVSFPTRKSYIYSSVLGATLLSILFTAIIIIAYYSSIYQLRKQRQISEIKTDFINNMTHEFKTPIATINLALDAIKNPKVIDNTDMVKRYLAMIKDENKRMHAQVENVLRISKLEKNELNISKERLNLNDLVNDAVAHIELIVLNKNGYVKMHLHDGQLDVLANENHFVNVIVNILDNAVKYSDENPKIDVYTERVGNYVLISIKDQGNGMSKVAQKRVFEKFYREYTGNVHNVKGHGLGLSYVKQIVDDHNGHVSVESEKGKGSVFTIKLPLIS